MFREGDKAVLHIRTQNGSVSFPGIIYGEPYRDIVTTRAGVELTQWFAEMLTLRQPNPNGVNADSDPYLKVTPENLTWVTRRFDSVVGLDVAEDGTLLDIEALEGIRAASIVALQNAAAVATAPASATFDSLEQAAGA